MKTKTALTETDLQNLKEEVKSIPDMAEHNQNLMLLICELGFNLSLDPPNNKAFEQAYERVKQAVEFLKEANKTNTN